METSDKTASTPPSHLPIDPRHFYAAPLGTQSIPLVPQPETQHVLEQGQRAVAMGMDAVLGR